MKTLNGYCLDITTQKYAELDLISEKEEIELYLQILTQDIGNDLLVAKGWLDILLLQHLPTNANDFIKNTRSSIMRANLLSKNILVLIKSLGISIPETRLL